MYCTERDRSFGPQGPSFEVVRRAATVDRATQAPDFVEEVCQREYQGIKYSRRIPELADPLHARLSDLKRKIYERRVAILSAKKHWAHVVDRDPKAAERVAKHVKSLNDQLVSDETAYWELNVADPTVRAQERSRDSFEFARKVQEVTRAARSNRSGGAPDPGPVPRSTQSERDRLAPSRPEPDAVKTVSGQTSRRQRKRANRERKVTEAQSTVSCEPLSPTRALRVEEWKSVTCQWHNQRSHELSSCPRVSTDHLLSDRTPRRPEARSPHLQSSSSSP